nr:Asp23/Gls24 family envelope stress response protein [Carbonactinospora thermoautotrophica]
MSTEMNERAQTRAGPSGGREPEKVPQGTTALATKHGRTTIADTVVAKIVGMAAREVNGVYSMGSGAARAFGTLRGRVPGMAANVTQGVSVDVGERQAAADINLVVEYGVSIPDLAASVRRNVITAVERMSGLEVTEVNINVDDVHLPSDEQEGQGREESESEEPRVR